MTLDNELLYKKDSKTGRNEPCPCGSGKKYKKCCIGTGLYSTGSFASIDELNKKQSEENKVGSSGKEIWELDLYELKQINISNLNSGQLKLAMRRSIKLGYFDMAISFIQELRNYYTLNNGTMYVKATKLIVEGQQIINDAENELYDDILHDLVMAMEGRNKKDMIELVTSLYFDKKSAKYTTAQFYVAISKKDTQYIIKHMEKLATSGIESVESLVVLSLNLCKDYPGLALMAFRSVISAYPDHDYGIVLLKDNIRAFQDDLSLDSYDILCDYFDESDEESEHVEITEMKQELNIARKESYRQQKLVDKLKQQQKTLEQPQKKYSLEETETETETDIDTSKEQIILGKRKIETLQGIIKNKQEAIKELKTKIPQEYNNIENKEEVQVEEEHHEIDFDITSHVIPKISIPEYSKEFIKSQESEEPAIARKALVSITGFTINDLKVLKQTKKIKAVENYYSIRLGIHHRLLVEYTHNRPPIAQYLIHRKDLEKYIKKIQQSQMN